MKNTTFRPFFASVVLALPAALASLGSLALALAAPPARADTVRIAMIETLSGVFAPTGQNLLRSYQTFAEMANRQNWTGAGHTIEVVPFDNHGSLPESLALLQSAIDQGYHYIAQGNGSHIAAALIDAVNRNNAANPGKEVVFLNHSAVDPDLTNQKCSFWHFRFDAHSDMKMEGLTNLIQSDPGIRKVYVIGQNYAFGQQVSRAARDYLQRKRPDIEIVGDELHPIAQVKDFSPHVARIQASGADIVITGNWDADLSLLIKAAREAGLKARFYTYYAGMSSGVTGTMGASEVGKVRQIGNWHPNTENFAGREIQEAYKRKYNENFYATPVFTIVTMLAKAVKEAHSVEPVKVAFALEGLKIQGLAGGEVQMRASDHQVQGTLFISTWTRANGQDVKYDEESTGYGWKTDQRINPATVELPTTCQMARPAR